jgi:formamidopyrimidine-DNA glycosylase
MPGGRGIHDHVVFVLDDGTRIVYTDPRRFGLMDIVSNGTPHPLLADLGVEPLEAELNAEHLWRAFRGKRAPLKAALIDQRLIAGLGNIYACEALFRARLSPLRMASTLARRTRPDQRLEALVTAIRGVLSQAIEAGGSTLRDYARIDGSPGGFQTIFEVYDREGEACLRDGCPGIVRRIVQSGRSTFYCPRCQRWPGSPCLSSPERLYSRRAAQSQSRTAP